MQGPSHALRLELPAQRATGGANGVSQPVDASGDGANHYEITLLRFWSASRPVARVRLATVPDRRACRALRAAWALERMAEMGIWHLRSCRGCGMYPTATTCAQCLESAWCEYCSAWSRLCWKCYRPCAPWILSAESGRLYLKCQDRGEFVPGVGGPGGDGGFENRADLCTEVRRDA